MHLNKILFILLIAVSCNPATITDDSRGEADQAMEQEDKIFNDTTPKVTGIGGIFFTSTNPKETNEWYGKNLGMAIDGFG